MALDYLHGWFGESIVRSDPLRENSKYIKQNDAKKEENMVLELIEGKKALMFQSYCLLAEILFKISKREHVAAHFFLLLVWNFISRA